jgi:hypothetical protein
MPFDSRSGHPEDRRGVLASLRALGVWRALALLVAGFVVTGALAAWLLSLAITPQPVPLHIRWKTDVGDAERASLEQQFHVIEGHRTEGTTFVYLLTDPSTESIRAIVQHPRVDDTAHINRIRFRPEFAYDRTRRIFFYSVLAGGAGALVFLVQAARKKLGINN